MDNQMENYTIIDNNQISNEKLSDGAFRCHTYLLSMCYETKDTCYPSIKYIANTLNKSTRSIDRYLKELVKLGLLNKTVEEKMEND